MFKTIRNLSCIVKDIAVIAGKESAYQLGKANESSTTATSKLADRTASMRQQYEQKLKERKAKGNDPTQKVINVLPAPQEQDN